MQLTSTDGAVFELRPSGYEYATLTTPGELDANWLIVHGTVRTAAGESWTFDEPSLTTWEAQELLSWLHAAAEGRLEPTDDPGSDVVTSTLMFIEPNLAFSVAAVKGEQTLLRLHLSLEAVAGKPDRTTGPRPGLYAYSIPFWIDQALLLAAAKQWSSDIAPFPARQGQGTTVVGRSPRLWLTRRAHAAGRSGRRVRLDRSSRPGRTSVRGHSHPPCTSATLDVYTPRRFAMSKTHIDIDDELLAQVAAITGTTTKRDTVESALRTVLHQQRRRAAAERLITRAESGYFAPLLQEHPKAAGDNGQAPDTDDRRQGAT